ncbi:MAG: PD40 domain-containing protein [Cyclobacteriaceae bacterium]|nr:PD40 domain-containing protein [Cyclobacteriaceae bacterium]
MTTVIAQEKESGWFINRMEPLAKEYYRIGDYKKGLEGYLSLDSASPGNTEYNYRIGICYLNTSFKNRAYPYLEFAYKQKDAPENIFYEMGRAYHYGHEFQKAIIFYESYRKELLYHHEAEKNGEEVRQVDRFIQMCRNGLLLARNPLINVEVVNLGPEINSPYSDFSPLINKNEDMIIFTSKRQATPGTKSDPLTNQFFESIFYSTRKGGIWTEAASIGKPVHHDDIHDAAVGLSPDGSRLFLYQGDKNLFKSKIAGDLYWSEYAAGRWTDPVRMEGINSGSWESHASITELGDLIVFTSDREGGMGGTDIYFSNRNQEGIWSSPENIGGYINTVYDEDGPFIHPDGNKLYFSSKGHNSMGGYDIFFSEYLVEKDRWTRPENAGYPVNTADDDIFFVWSADGERAYFSSEREDSFGETDIYMLIRNDVDTNIIEISGEISDRITGNPVSAALIVREMLSNQLIGIFNVDDKKGSFRIKLRAGRRYLLTIRSSGYEDLVSELDLMKPEYPVQILNFKLRSWP